MIHSKQKSVCILLLYQEFSPRQYLIARTLKERGYIVNVIAWNRSGRIHDTRNIPAFINQWHSITIKAPTGKISAIWGLLLFYRRLSIVIRSQSEQSLWFYTHMLLLPVKDLCKGIRVYDASEMYCIDFSRYLPLPRSWIKKFISLVEGVLVRNLNGILTIDSKDGWLESYYRDWNENVQVLWNVPSLKDDPDLEEVERLRARYNGKKLITFIGGLSRRKGLRVALEAAEIVTRQYEDVLFLFIGTLRDEKKEIVKLISNLNNKIEFVEWIPYRKVLAYLNISYIALALHQKSSLFEFVGMGNGRKFFTYMQAGIPVIASDFASVGEIVCKTGCGKRVDCSSPEVVSHAICEYLQDEDLASKSGRLGRIAFEKKYNWEKESSRFIRFLQELGVLDLVCES